MIGQTLWTEFFSNKDWPVASAIAVVLLVLLVRADRRCTTAGSAGRWRRAMMVRITAAHAVVSLPSCGEGARERGKRIAHGLRERTPTPDPSPQGGGERRGSAE